MEKRPQIYKFSIAALILSAFILIIYTTAITILLIVAYYKNLYLGLSLAIPLLVFLFDPLTRFFRILYYAIISKPALILLDDRLVDNVNNLIIYWDEIEHIRFVNKSKFGGQIAVKPKDLTMLLGRVEIPYKKIIFRINQKYFNGAVSISPNLLKCKRDNLYHELVNTNFKKQITSVLHRYQ